MASVGMQGFCRVVQARLLAHIRSDNGADFVAEMVRCWLQPPNAVETQFGKASHLATYDSEFWALASLQP